MKFRDVREGMTLVCVMQLNGELNYDTFVVGNVYEVERIDTEDATILLKGMMSNHLDISWGKAIMFEECKAEGWDSP